MNIRNFSSVTDRRKALEEKTGVSLDNIGTFSLDESIASTRNCENMIGVAQVPLGIAGPLRLNTHDYFIPLATTEGALVASINRGCKAITESGGAHVESTRTGATRGPVFKVIDVQDRERLCAFLDSHTEELKKLAATTSRHIKLNSFTTKSVGSYIYVRFVFDTDDAMGMNMVTIATQALVTYIHEQTGVNCLALAGNFDIDKKPSWLNAIESRGVNVFAEVILPQHVVHHVLKTEAKNIYEVWLAKCMIGSALSGSLGFNAQFANVIAALFLATGQDLGHVGEGSIGITTTEVKGDDLYVSVNLPDVMVGTVGGGTRLATQNEALSLLGVSGGQNGNNALSFASIVGAAVLAGEISLLASLSEGSLTHAHKKLGRGIHI